MYLYAPVLSFNLKGLTSTETAKLLDEKNIAVRAGFHCAPTAHKQIGTLKNGTVRVSVSAFNSMNEAEYFLKVINDIKIFKKV